MRSPGIWSPKKIPSGRFSTCPAAISYWQILGWWTACHFAYTAEVLWRQTFLRTTPARRFFGRTHEAAAQWPFDDVAKIAALVLTSCCISLPCLIWIGLIPSLLGVPQQNRLE